MKGKAERVFRRGETALKKGKHKNALKHFKKAVDALESNSHERAEALNLMGMLEPDSNKAIQCLLEAQAIYSTNPQTDPMELSGVYHALAAVYLRRNDYDIAREYYSREVTCMEASGFFTEDQLKESRELYERLLMIHENKDKYSFDDIDELLGPIKYVLEMEQD